MVSAVRQTLMMVWQAFVAATGRMDKSLSVTDTLAKVQRHRWQLLDGLYVVHVLLAAFWLFLLPSLLLKLAIPALYLLALLIPFTSQFFFPAMPVLSWVLCFFSSRYIPNEWRPNISVVVLPTLEMVLFGANISDILTRSTFFVLDIVAWIPYGVGHFSIPFITAAFLWLFRPKQALHFWASAFGYMNLIGVLIQILFPCAAPWYELIHGLTPADYGMKGSPGGLIRIDALLHTSAYTVGFSNAPVVFGAFPSLHAGSATIEALAISHFFPNMSYVAWGYALTLYWATMYLTHHYLIDVVVGACLATVTFYYLLPEELKGSNATAAPGELLDPRAGIQRSKYDMYDLEAPRSRPNGNLADASADFELSDVSDDEEMDITYRSPIPGATPTSAAPLIMGQGRDTRSKRGHRHTASIASLIRGDERSAEEGWSQIGGNGFSFPPTPTRATRE
ncbi:PAP2-domain-containing protein [Hymenopellis radicata]|nr:PAP2-domain-containing protein [Hymenopellis radicata]